MESDGPLGDRERSVLAALEGGERPLSAYDILGRARLETLKAPVQVYRALKKLERLGLVHRIEALNAFVPCTHGRHRAHRPGFVICRACGTTREFEDGRIDGLAAEAAGEGFSVDLVALEVYGRCASCAAADATTHRKGLGI